jgi:hypothetical protein
MLSTLEGIQIDESDEHRKNARPSIPLNFDALSNVIVERRPHRAKHFCPINLRDEGTQIDESDEQLSKEHPAIRKSFEPTSNENV